MEVCPIVNIYFHCMLLTFQFQAHNDLSAKCLIDRVTSVGSKSSTFSEKKEFVEAQLHSLTK